MTFWPIKEKRFEDKHGAYWKRYHPAKKPSKWNLMSKFIVSAVIFICAAVALLFSGGCANHHAIYSGIDKDGKPFTIELQAKRFIMGQEVQGFSAEFPGGYKVGFNSSQSDQVKTMEAFFTVMGPILKAYTENQPGAR